MRCNSGPLRGSQPPGQRVPAFPPRALSVAGGCVKAAEAGSPAASAGGTGMQRGQGRGASPSKPSIRGFVTVAAPRRSLRTLAFRFGQLDADAHFSGGHRHHGRDPGIAASGSLRLDVLRDVRPSEAVSLTINDCTLPGQGWGLLQFSEIRSAAGRQ
jgi:hypothetical protein